MRRSVSGSIRCASARLLSVGLSIVAGVSVASAQTTVTLSKPTSQVVFATVRGGPYANTNLNDLLETRASDTKEFVRRSLLKFDTQNTIPKGSHVTSAIMTVTVKNASDDATRRIGAYQVTNSWTETEVTWNMRRADQRWARAGGDLGSRIDDQVVGKAGTKVSFDVTPLVQQAVGGKLGSSRYTRIALVDLDSATKESYRAYYTPDDSNSAVRPALKVTYGAQASAPAPSSSGATLRVLEYNVHHGGIGTDGKYDPNRVVNAILKANPDVISLCEMEKNDSYVSTDGVALYKSLLEKKTGRTWYTWDIQDYGDWSSAGIRNAIISRLPFVATHRLEFSVGKDRTVGVVTVNVNGRNINVFSTHFDPDSRTNRTKESAELITYAGNFSADQVVMGDFNDQPTQAPITKLTGTFIDGWAAGVSAHVAESPSDNPNGYTRNSRIDYVFYRPRTHLTLSRIEVIETRDSNGYMPSDHRPLLAVFHVN